MKLGWRVKKIRVSQSLITSLFLTIAVSSAVVAQSKSQAPKELERLKYFAGTWSCQQPADSSDPAGEFIWHVELGLNDFWYLGDASQKLTPENGQPINSQEFLGYDVVAKKLTRSVVVGNGNSYNLAADDWQDNKLVWEGTIIMGGKSTLLKEEIIRDTPNKFTATYFVPGKQDSWIPVVNESCDRI